MTHNETRSEWWKEGLISLGTGTLYGMTSVAVGHPFDTIKTKMQAQSGFMNVKGGGASGTSGSLNTGLKVASSKSSAALAQSKSMTMMSAFGTVLRTQGIVGLYKGWFPPLWGSGIYRSVQFAVFEALYTKWDNEFGKAEIPGTYGLQNRVLGAGLIASFTRAVIECPIEFAKVARQTGQSWEMKSIYKGFGLQLGRTGGVMTTYFIIIDSCRRNYPEIFKTQFGQFVASAGAATFGFWVVWPLEVLKNQVQAGTKLPGMEKENVSAMERIKWMLRKDGGGGFSALYRGIFPGTLRSILSNGCSMVVMVWAQKQVTKLGLRNK